MRRQPVVQCRRYASKFLLEYQDGMRISNLVTHEQILFITIRYKEKGKERKVIPLERVLFMTKCGLSIPDTKRSLYVNRLTLLPSDTLRMAESKGMI